jgi:hypothetical protein
MLQTSNLITSEQMILLVNACTMLHKFAVVQEDDSPGAVDKDARDAIVATIVNISTRIDKLLGEDKRWDTGQAEGAVSAATAMHQEQANFLKVSKNLSEMEAQKTAESVRPYRVRNVAFYCLSNGEFMACDGDPSVGHSIKATGKTPEEAALNFDLTWKGIVEYKPFSVPIKLKSKKQTQDEAPE